MTLKRGGRRSTARMATLAVAALAVTGSGVAFASGSGPHVDARQEAKASSAVAPPKVVAPPMVEVGAHQSPSVVKAGERLAVGRGNSVWLTKDGQLVADIPGVTGGHIAEPAKALDPIVPDASISLRISSENAGTLYWGFYKGSGKLVRVTVRKDGKTLNAKVVTLAGTPGWAAFYVDGPAIAGLTYVKIRGWTYSGWTPSSATVTGYSPDGSVLAQFKPIARR